MSEFANKSQADWQALAAKDLKGASPDSLIWETPEGIKVKRMGFAPTTCPPSPALEDAYYPNPATIASAVHAMVRPTAAPWQPDALHTKMAYQVQFRGPF